MTPRQLVLASGSPRRRELLDRLGLAFVVVAPDVDETIIEGEDAGDYVRRLARAKAEAADVDDAAVIAADTAVVVDGQVLGKPTDPAHAHEMLRRLSGRAHEVLTGVAVRVSSNATMVVDAEATTVQMTDLSPDRLTWYVATGDGADKAGGYALQGAAGLFVDRVEGSVSNVIGLPLPLVDRLCRQAGIDLLSFRSSR